MNLGNYPDKSLETAHGDYRKALESPRAVIPANAGIQEFVNESRSPCKQAHEQPESMMKQFCVYIPDKEMESQLEAGADL